MTTPSESSAVLVTGDIIVDRHFYHSAKEVREVAELGGAAMLHRLLATAFAEGRDAAGAELKIEANLGVEAPALTAIPASHNAYAVWAPFKLGREKDAKSVWRVQRPLGYGPEAERREPPFLSRSASEAAPRVLVLDDGGFGFRDIVNSSLWRLPGPGGAEPDWIVLKMSHPIGHGDLWHDLKHRFADKLICIVSAHELRDEPVVIGKGASWERAVEDIAVALTTNAVLKTLCDCRHLIVTISIDGALWIDWTDRASPKATLIFDAERAEGEWGEQRDGSAFGYLTCMMSAIAYGVATGVAAGAEIPGLAPAIDAGLRAMRNLLEEGHGPATHAPSGYPLSRLAKLLVDAKSSFASAPVAWPPRDVATRAWTMTSDAAGAPEDAGPSVVFGLARQVVIGGSEALSGVPHARFGDLITADRSEIEALRDLRRLMREYKAAAKSDKPLSLGVFGPPGAGKSFGVNQLAKEVFGEKAWLPFNLSQFDGPRDLVGAFHQARDKAISGETPVVFWDEFDSRAHFWLQYLLAPMQDGKFQDQQLSHSIGKCVFVFAGGTSFSYENFKAKAGLKAEADFALAKGPDFKSRLDGYYNVLGPNQRVFPTPGCLTHPTSLGR